MFNEKTSILEFLKKVETEYMNHESGKKFSFHHDMFIY